MPAITGFFKGVLVCENPRPSQKVMKISKRTLAKIRKSLEEERDRLHMKMESFESVTFSNSSEANNEARGYSIHPAEHATDNQVTEISLGLRFLEDEQLRAVEEALDRLDQETFGACQTCGEKIDSERLLAKPSAHLCRGCRRIFEARRR